MSIFKISILFYLQNFIISLFYPFVFIPSIFEFLTIIAIVTIIQKFNYYKQLLYIWQLLYFIHFSFIAYFGTAITYVDIYLFFTHIDDTFETLSSMYNILLIPFIMSLISILIIYISKPSKHNISNIILLPILLLFIGINLKISDASFILVDQIYNTHKLYDNKKPIPSQQKKPTAITKQDINIVLIIGESMRAKEFLENKYNIFEHYNYKTIYSGATNTDVSIPLLINGAQRPTQIDLNHNLFYLAKQNDFNTTFISTQSKNSLKYIDPYLNKKYIDRYDVQKSLDIDLAKKLNKIDLSQSNLIILQMQGQHSPYLSYPNSTKDDSILTRYNKSMNYSNNIIEQLINIVKTKSTHPYLFLFTSDHGEFLGENGRYGHNRFEEEIYKVPLVYISSQKLNLAKIQNHADIYQTIYTSLGYNEKIKYSNEIKVYGTMISEEDGYIQLSPSN